jgi:hypothetical protein
MRHHLRGALMQRNLPIETFRYTGHVEHMQPLSRVKHRIFVEKQKTIAAWSLPQGG